MDNFTQIWINIGGSFLLLKEFDRAKEIFEFILRNQPYNSQVLSKLALVLHQQKYYKAAAENYRRVISLNDLERSINVDTGHTWSQMAHCYLMLNDFPRAFQSYQQAISLGCTDSQVWFGVGVLYDHYFSNQHALESFSTVIKLEGYLVCQNNPFISKVVPNALIRETYFRLGKLLRYQNSFKGSLSCFNYLLTFVPSSISIFHVQYQIALSIFAQNDHKNSLMIIEKILKDHSSISDSLLCDCKILLGWIMWNFGFSLSDGHPEKELIKSNAIKALKSSHLEFPKDSRSAFFLSRIHQEIDDYDTAYALLIDASSRDSSNIAILNSLSIVLLKLNRMKESLDAISQAMHLQSDLPSLWWNLGILYQNCENQMDDASAAFKRAHELLPQDLHIKTHCKNIIDKNLNTNQYDYLNMRQIDILEFTNRSVNLF